MTTDRTFTTPDNRVLAVDNDNFITGTIEMSLDEIIDSTTTESDALEGFLDELSERLTGSILLMDISYRTVGYNVDDQTIIIEVTGDISEILTEE